jgi:hypothetical protein
VARGYAQTQRAWAVSWADSRSSTHRAIDLGRRRGWNHCDVARRRGTSRRTRRTLRASARRTRQPGEVDWSQIRWSSIDRAIAGVDRDSLISLIAAAADSPGCGHRLPSLTVLWTRAVTRHHHGRQAAGSAGLAKLLAAAHRAAPQLRYVEDCWNADSRLRVCHPVQGERLRIHPGAHTDPYQLMRVIESTAQAIDAFTLERHGFALSDLVEAGLRYSDWRTTRLSEAWAGELARDEPEPERESLADRIGRIAAAPAQLSEAELEVARSLRETDAVWLTQCTQPHRARAAWDWATIPGGELSVQLEPLAVALGAVLAVEHEGLSTPVPASLVLDALASSTGVLAAAASSDVASVGALRKGTFAQAGRILKASPQFAVDSELDQAGDSGIDSGLPSGSGLVIVAIAGRRHAFAFAVASGLDERGLLSSIGEAESMLSEISARQLLANGAALEEDAVVRSVVLYGGPLREAPGTGAGVPHLHVEDLASISYEVGDPKLGFDLVYQFLDELVSMPGIAEIRSFEHIDTWRHWRKQGVLNPTGEREVTLVIAGPPDDTAWEQAARWEPIEAVLTAAGLPPRAGWYVAELDDQDGRATLYSDRLDLLLVLAEPPLVIATSLAGGLAELRFDPAFCLGLVDGVMLTCVNYPGVASGLRLDGDAPVILQLEFIATRTDGSGDDRIGLGFAAVSDPRPLISVQIGVDWLELLAEDPGAAHALLGNAIGCGRDRLHEQDPNGEWPATRAKFIAAWEAAPPVAMLHVGVTSLPVRFNDAESLPRSTATAARARRTLAEALIEDDVARCELLGPRAEDLCRKRILPAAVRALGALVSRWSSDAILLVAEHLNEAHGERARSTGELERALAAPWGANWRSRALDGVAPWESVRPLEYLLELLVAEQPTGSIAPDRFDIAETVDLAGLVAQIGRAAEGAAKGLHSLAVLVGPGGLNHVVAVPDSEQPAGDWAQQQDRSRPSVDVDGYLAAERAHRVRLRDASDLEPSLALDVGQERPFEASPFVALASVGCPGSLLKADRLMRGECGHGWDAINAVLGTALSWTQGGDGVVVLGRAELRDAAQTWSSVSVRELEAALERLTLDADVIAGEGVRFWEQDRRPQRLLTNPLVASGGDLIVMPRQIEATQAVYARYLSEGRLPWPHSEIPPRVRDAFNSYRQLVNHDLERVAAEIAAEQQLPHKANIDEKEAAKFGLHLPGEVDLLIADSARSRLWVCEVKDLMARFSPGTLTSSITKFLDREDHIAKLLARVKAVGESPKATARLLEAPGGSKPWRVLPLMITRNVEIAAFLENVPVTFTVVADLASTLRSARDPDHGQTPVGSR